MVTRFGSDSVTAVTNLTGRSSLSGQQTEVTLNSLVSVASFHLFRWEDSLSQEG